MLELTHPDDRGADGETFQRYLRAETNVYSAEKRYLRKDGLIRWVSVVARMLRDPDGRPRHSIGIVQDITARKRAENAVLQAYEELDMRVRMRTAELQTANFALSASEERFRQMSESIHEVFYLIDVHEKRTLYVSPAYEEIWGAPRDELYQNSSAWLKAIHPEDLIRVNAFARAARVSESLELEYRIVRPDGSCRWIWDQRSPVHDPTGAVYRVAGVALDITQRKLAEEALQRAHRALLVLKECDEALARAGSESELLNRVCQIILQMPGVRVAWVGLAQSDERRTVLPVACAGVDAKRLNSSKVTWADEPQGQGLVGTAIRTAEVQICRDTRTDPRVAPWRTRQLRQGYVASIAIPLVWENSSLGALTIYSGRSDAFNVQEVELLKQLAGDLTYGLMALRTRAEREQLQKELLRIGEREKQVIAQELHDGLCQHLAGVAMMSGLLHRRLALRDDAEASQAKLISELLNTGVNEARNLSHGLHPVRSEADGLESALAQFAKTVSTLFHVQCKFECPEPVEVANESATHLFRIAQESVNNAIKHGQARRVTIALTRGETGITLTIRDNGIGIPRKPRGSGGMGMQIMKHRATTIGASLKVHRAGKRGTVVCCRLGGKNGDAHVS